MEKRGKWRARRLLEAGLTTIRRLAPADAKRHDGTIVTERPDVM